MRPVALALIALTAGCSAGPAEGDLLHPACVTARDDAVLEGLQWLSNLEVSGVQAADPDRDVFYELGARCANDPAGAYSDFLVRAHAGFRPASPAGEVARRQFLNAGCGEAGPYPLRELTEEARRVCTGG
jgi:hypothetical protein